MIIRKTFPGGAGAILILQILEMTETASAVTVELKYNDATLVKKHRSAWSVKETVIFNAHICIA